MLIYNKSLTLTKCDFFKYFNKKNSTENDIITQS